MGDLSGDGDGDGQGNVNVNVNVNGADDLWGLNVIRFGAMAGKRSLSKLPIQFW